VHPSWRDLVISRLAGDGPARRRFLGRCGVHGVILALSTAGGATGKLRFPLLAEDEDWDAITDRVCALLAELEPAELAALLAALGAGIDDLGSDGAGREVRALAATALTHLAKLWRAARQPIALGQLEAWLELARRLSPRPALPELGVTWAELLPVRPPAVGDRAEVERFTEWLTLCRLLRAYDPRLRLAGSGEAAQIRVAAGFLDEVERDLPAASSVHVARAIDAIDDLVPYLSNRARLLAGLARPPEAVDTWSSAPPPPTPFEESREMQGFDVTRVLMDL
jgi:hypothetical protein